MPRIGPNDVRPCPELSSPGGEAVRADRSASAPRSAGALLLAAVSDRLPPERLLGAIASADARDLNAFLAAVSFDSLVAGVDRAWFSDGALHALWDLLSKTRLGDISVENRARMIEALQSGWTKDADERVIGNILLGTFGSDLTRLKRLIDAGGNRHDLLDLLYSDIDSSPLRAAILEHIRVEARGTPCREVKVMSDIDDTFVASLKDRRYPKDSIYPGVRQFYRELDAGPSGQALGDVAFLTARPRSSEERTHRMLREHGVREAPVLEGDMWHLRSHEAMAEKKIENFSRFAQAYPEFGYVFIGDNGQGDAIAGSKMLELEPRRMRAVFIHDIGAMSSDELARFSDRGVFFFTNYVDAATEAFRRALIDGEALVRVIDAAQKELDALPFATDEQRAARVEELRRSSERARASLPPPLGNLVGRRSVVSRLANRG